MRSQSQQSPAAPDKLAKRFTGTHAGKTQCGAIDEMSQMYQVSDRSRALLGGHTHCLEAIASPNGAAVSPACTVGHDYRPCGLSKQA